MTSHGHSEKRTEGESEEPTEFTDLSEEQMLRINRLCDQFEADWKSGKQPTVESILQQTPSADRTVAIVELLPLEIEYRHRAGTALRLDEYVTRFPTLDRIWLAGLLESASIAVPDQLGDYLILERIGGGGMGTVYKALHQRMGRTVAVKVLRSELQNNADLLLRFDREVRAAARLNHRNIVAALDAREDQGIHYLVTEYVEGFDLERQVRKNGPMALKAALETILQAARGLEYAHSQGIIHRDIKPANLLRDANGVVKILDMGLARFDGSAEVPHDALTKTGMVMGTAHFMAPEQARDTRRADARSDLYSLGCTFFYLVTGKVPFAGETAIDTILSHVNRPAPSLKEVANLPAVVDAIFQKLVAKEPQDRFQSASELIEAIKGLGQKSSTVVSPTALPRRSEPLPPTVVAETEESSESKPNRSGTTLLAIAAGLLIVAVAGIWYFNSSPVAEVTSAEGPGERVTQQSSLPPQSAAPIQQSSPEPPSPVTSPATRPPDPQVKFSLEFDGHSSYAHIPELRPVAGEPYTIEVVGRVRGITVANVISWLGPDWMALFVNQNGWGIGRKFQGKSYLVQTGRPPELQRTQHVAATYDGADFKLFIDGRLVQTMPTEFEILDADGGLYIGGVDRKDLDEIRYFDGYLDVVRISSGIRYTADFTPPKSFEHDGTTLALFLFNSGRGETCESLDPKPYTARLRNTLWHPE